VKMMAQETISKRGAARSMMQETHQLVGGRAKKTPLLPVAAKTLG